MTKFGHKRPIFLCGNIFLRLSKNGFGGHSLHRTLVQKRGFFHGGFPLFLLFGVKSDVQERGVAVSTPGLLDVAVSMPKLLDVTVSTPDRLYSDNTVSYSFHLDTFDILWLSFHIVLIDIIMRGCACIIILSYDYEMRIIEKRM